MPKQTENWQRSITAHNVGRSISPLYLQSFLPSTSCPKVNHRAQQEGPHSCNDILPWDSPSIPFCLQSSR